MTPLNELFKVTYGNKLDLNKMELAKSGERAVNFVGRSSRNHGVSAQVVPLSNVKPYPAGSITVALGGTKLLASFVQLEPFYTAQNVAVCQPLSEMTFAEKLYACLCIRHNRFRYSAFGREANRTLRTLLIPDLSSVPNWVHEVNLDALASPEASDPTKPLPILKPRSTDGWSWFTLSELFDVKKGKRLTKADIKPGGTAFISALDSNNGLRQRIEHVPLHSAGVVTVNYNGNGVAEAFYQPEPFVASDDVNVLYPKFDASLETCLFICTIIRREKYRFSYGRKWTMDRMKQSQIKLPTTSAGCPDWDQMTSMIQALLPQQLMQVGDAIIA